jgi:hypothetical protein
MIRFSTIAAVLMLVLIPSVSIIAGTGHSQPGSDKGPMAPPQIEDQFFTDKLCSLREPRELQIVATDPDGDELTFEKVEGPGTIDALTGLLTYTPDTSGVFTFIVAVFDASESDTATIRDSVFLNEPAHVERFDSTIHLCEAETICFGVMADDPDDEKIDILFLEGPGEFIQDNDSAGTVCFEPADLASKTYMFVFRGKDSCTSADVPESIRDIERLAALSPEFCCLDTIYITVVIDQPPVLACPGEILIDDCTLDEYCFAVSAVDPEQGPISIRILSGNATVSDTTVCFSVFGSDEFEIMIETADSCGRADTCSVSVTVDCGETVHFDVKPTSCPNPLNLRGNWQNGRSVIPAAILGTANFDVREIDPATVRLEGVPPERWNYEDVTRPVTDRTDSCDCTGKHGDGYDDLTLKFGKAAVIEALGDRVHQPFVIVTVTGELYDGTRIKGYDCLIIRNGGATRPSADDDEGGTGRAGLVGNSPNPFNPMTVISYYLPAGINVKLEVFNLLGQKVSTLLNSYQEAGMHEVEWDGTSDQGEQVVSGVYLYRLSAGSIVQTRKMVLMK